MSNISNLLNDAQSTYRQQLSETKKYVAKWEKTGLLEGIDHDYEKHNTAILLENQARELVTENSKTGGASSEEWNGVALPLVRRIFGEIFAKEFVSVQPMNLPSGLVFWLDFKYGTTVGPNQTAATDVMGNTSSSASPTGGLYGKGKESYTLKRETHALETSEVNSTVADGATFPVNVSAIDADLDLDLVDSIFFTSASVNVNAAGTCTLNAAGTVVTVTNAKGSAMRTGDVLTANFYRNTLTAASRGDFEDTDGTQGSTVTNDIGIPEMNVELRQEALVAKTRKLKVVWSPEFAQDLNAYHSIDAEAELTSMLSEYISMEIDMEILSMLDRAANTVTASQGTFVLSGSSTGYVPVGIVNGSARYDFGTWAQTLGYEMQKVSNSIHKLTMRGGANFAVLSPEIASIIESIPGFAADTDGTASQFAAGVTKVGSFANRYTIYKNPYRATSDGILMGFRGNQFLETGAVYAPYIPLIMTPLVYDPTNFTPRKGVMTRYAKKVVRPEFYGKVAVTIHA
jgi:hypothetical protein|tara:strand:+ start:2071 stop:3615 length:1545 start_codon:yes stop_codon:yes gene_type:complete